MPSMRRFLPCTLCPAVGGSPACCPICKLGAVAEESGAACPAVTGLLVPVRIWAPGWIKGLPPLLPVLWAKPGGAACGAAGMPEAGILGCTGIAGMVGSVGTAFEKPGVDIT